MAPFALLVGFFATRQPPAFHAAATAPEGQTVPPSGHTPADFERMIDGLRAKLSTDPRNVDDWVLLGRSLAALARWEEAEQAFARAIALRPAEPVLHVQRGEVLTLAAQGRVTQAAAAEFAHAPDDPRSRYYAALALAQAGDAGEARKRLQALAADAPPDAKWLHMVQDELANLDAAPAPPRPAAEPASPVAHLKARTAANPHDAEAWLALSRAYQAAGDRAQALDTLRRANQAVAGNLDLLLAYAELLGDGIKGDQLPEAFVAVMRQVQTIDPDQPDALWYLGLDAAARGDSHRAATYWRRLVGRLPPGSDERASVQQRLKMLP
jgi:cytochrome c-type biogenesis protein CcmH